jgi:N-dimethylarginine dimethylaminohydrolase
MITNCPVSIYSEFQPLEEVLVGQAYPPGSFAYSQDSELRDGIDRILSETEEDLQKLVGIFESFGVKVRRPSTLFELGTATGKARTLDLNLFDFTFPNHPLMPRDTVLVAGNQLIQTYTKSANRYLENWAYYSLFKEYFDQGARWTSMPAPFFTEHPPTYDLFEDKKVLFHAANLLKCGKDIFFSQAGEGQWNEKGKGTSSGIKWLQQELGERYRFHAAPCAGHLDGKIALLKPGLVITWNPKHIPAALSKWDIIQVNSPNPFPEYFQKIKKQRFYKDFVQQWLKEWIGYVDETVFDVNMFSVSEKCVITNGYNKDVFDQLKHHGVEAIPWNFRHQYFWDGAIHCVTLDIRRSGGLEDYTS